MKNINSPHSGINRHPFEFVFESFEDTNPQGNYEFLKHSVFLILPEGHTSEVVAGIQIRNSHTIIIDFPIGDGLYKILLLLAYFAYKYGDTYPVDNHKRAIIRRYMGSVNYDRCLSRNLSEITDEGERNKIQLIQFLDQSQGVQVQMKLPSRKNLPTDIFTKKSLSPIKNTPTLVQECLAYDEGGEYEPLGYHSRDAYDQARNAGLSEYMSGLLANRGLRTHFSRKGKGGRRK